MKVVCIHNRPKWVNHPYNYSLKKLIVGEIYTVLKVIDEGDGDFGYVLKEVKSDYKDGGFNSERFREIDGLFGEEVEKRISENVSRLFGLKNY